ncbi:MAG: hypothetical protein ACRDZ4_00375, partial [Egibacteraceae bacterium]
GSGITAGVYVALMQFSPKFRYNRAVAASGAITAIDDILLGTGGAGGITLTLPTAASMFRRVLTVVKVDAAAGAVTVDGSGAETIDGALSVLIASQYESVDFYSDGASWHVLATAGPKLKGSIQVGKTTGGLPGFVFLPVGANGFVLTADSTVDAGVAWAAAAGGGSTLGFITTAVNTALAATDVNKLVKATGGAGGITITLPDPTLAAVIGRPIFVKKMDAAAGAITVSQFAAETIDGAATVALASQYNSLQVVSDGTNWHLI